MEPATIEIRGAREHNLRGVSLDLPRNELICFTGVSGSGKSSLAFDTLYAEGQRRYVESLSSYARQFLGQLPKPDVDLITGLSPSISIQQKATGWNPRSTVGTVTQIYDYLRVLFARIGTQHCPDCGEPIQAQSREAIVGRVLELPTGSRVLMLAPVARGQKGEFRDAFKAWLQQGYLRARVDGEIVQLSDDLSLDKNIRHDIELVVDRLTVDPAARLRIFEAVEGALRLGDGSLIVHVLEDEKKAATGPAKRTRKRKAGGGRDILLSARYSCPSCGRSFEPPSPQLFSFNSPTGMCMACDGLGETYTFDESLLVPDDSKSFIGLAIAPMRTRIGKWRKHIYKGVADHVGFDLNTPWNKLPSKARQALLYGCGDDHITYAWRWSGGIYRHGGPFDGVIAELEEKYRKAKAAFVRRYYEKYMRTAPCTACKGERLNAQARAVRFGDATLTQLADKSVGDLGAFFEALELPATHKIIADDLVREIRGRLAFLDNVGLEYLSLDRGAPTLSGGESQRIRLASQIGSGLVGVLYILDEPSIGLHARDNRRLLASLEQLRDMGNTVVVVEHDEETMRVADRIVDFGPGPGVRGGKVVAEGQLEDIASAKDSVTAQYLTGVRRIETPEARRAVDVLTRAKTSSQKKTAKRTKKSKKKFVSAKQEEKTEGGWITVVGAKQNNLKDVDVSFPLGRFVCVTGVSGSGKSSLVNDILREVLARDLNGAEKVRPGAHERIDGLERVDKVVDIDQTPIGRTPRSNPATYIKVFDLIRDLYTKLPDSKVRGYKPGRFSFNVPTGKKGGGRCEACEGNGSNRIEMDFLADVWVTCPVCRGRRFSRETLQILFKGKSISDVLEMDVQDALAHFANVPKIAGMLQTLHDVGLDYIKLGQSSTTLSGGEAQRIKLARELVKKSTGQTVYLLDEPTTGLHFDDVRRLLDVLHGFVNAGNTVIVIEHNLDVIKTADWLIDLGPEGGEAGGRLIVEGTPETVANHKTSYTGAALRDYFAEHGKGNVEKSKRRKIESELSKQNRSSKSPSDQSPERERRVQRKGKNGSARTNGQNGVITVVGARQHNLKDVHVEIPRGKTTICTGLSGSGKSSFAMDTVYTEGQRRYVESLSSYARQFLGRLQKPRVDRIEGLPPAIAIEQKTAANTPRSTVGTVTEVYDYMRVLWARIGEPYCPTCGVPVGTQTSDEVVDRIMDRPAGAKGLLLAPIERVGSESYEDLLAREKANGFARVRVDAKVHEIDAAPSIDARRKHTVELVVDRLSISKSQHARIAESVEMALSVGNGVAIFAPVDGGDERFSQHHACAKCHTSYEELTPHNLSFNSRLGWCEVCEGLGTQQGAAASSIIARPHHSLLDGAILGWDRISPDSGMGAALAIIASELDFDINDPWKALPEAAKQALMHGCGPRWFDGAALGKDFAGVRFQWKGLLPTIRDAARNSWALRRELDAFTSDVPCEACGGSRLRADAAAIRLNDRTIHDACTLPLADVLAFFKSMKLDRRGKKVAGELLKEITSRLEFLVNVGLDYLTLHRSAPTLSGGESQRIRLAAQLGSGLTGVLYVLDEPTIGLHPRDNRRLIGALTKLRDLGNTLLMVEHDREVIEHADAVMDFGPGAGDGGGQIVAHDSPAKIRKSKESLTGKFLAGKEAIAVPTNRRPVEWDFKADAPVRADVDAEAADARTIKKKSKKKKRKKKSKKPAVIDTTDGRSWMEVIGAAENNLKDIDVAFPLSRLTVVTGVSGSGKSSLVSDILYPALARRVHRTTAAVGTHDEVAGVELIDKVINVDQSPIGNSPSSNPATYTGTFGLIRELFAQLPDSKIRGYTANRFSFNRAGGRCEACEGLGQQCIEMHFLPDVWVDCEACGGRRYERETLQVKYKNKSIADVLEMRVSEARELFANVPKLARMLQTLIDVGLDYVQLGQSAPTLSGGEAQRVKLAAELGRPQTGRTMYILDEPTTGLHFEDLRKLLAVLNRLVDLGNTVICIEHNLDVIKTADWVIDLGPEAGGAGGAVVAVGPPEKIAKAKHSHTGAVLAPVLKAGPHEERPLYRPEPKPTRAEEKIEVPIADVDATMPWERDGRAWHLEQRRDRNGREIQWSGDVLAWVVEQIEAMDAKTGRLAETDWNNRSRIEIIGKRVGATNWFMHALTGSQWLLDLSFRVPHGAFTERTLRRRLGIGSLDDRKDLPVYGPESRVNLRRANDRFDQVRVQLHDFEDVKKSAFKQFLREALDAYLDMMAAQTSKSPDAQPWKANGRGWHMSQKSLANAPEVAWQPATLVALVGKLSKLAPDLKFDWAQRTAVVALRADGSRWAKIHTNSRWGLKLEVVAARGVVTPAMIDRLGHDPKIAPKSKHDYVTIMVRELGDLDAGQLADLIQRTAAAESLFEEAVS